MSRLLVSVRCPDEAQVALDNGADLVDVKEPTRGSLGAADEHVVSHVLEAVRGRAPVSAALGELLAGPAPICESTIARLQYVKLGLAGCSSRPDWAEKWQRCLARLPPRVTVVAVVYADWGAAAAPPPAAVLEHGISLGCGAVLVDTFDKQGPTLTECWQPTVLRQFVRDAKAAGLTTVLGGRLSLQSIPQVAGAQADYVAVRGAACDGDRSCQLSAVRVAALARLVREL